MKHEFYYEFTEDNPFKMGFEMGSCFKEYAYKALERDIKEYKKEDWKLLLKKGNEYLKITQLFFPTYIEEFEGYARGAGIDFDYLWALSLETDMHDDKCTTLITNNNSLFLHVEEGFYPTKTEVCLVKKNYNNFSLMEIFYYNTHDGNACGYNSNGIIFSVNTLYCKNPTMGIPKNIFCKRMTNIKELSEVNLIYKYYPLGSSYNWNLINKKRDGYNIETTGEDYYITKIQDDFIHTNHYLTELSKDEKPFYNEQKNSRTSINRYNFAKKYINTKLTIDKMMEITEEIKGHNGVDLSSYHVDGRMIVDIKKKKAYFHLEREKDKGWVEYSLL